MKKTLASRIGLSVALVFGLFFSGQAQDARVFLDVPALYLHSSNVEKIQNNGGLGMDVGIGVGTHYLMTKLSAGSTVTADFQSDAIEETVLFQPFVRIEAGAGLWRSNGNQCAKHDSNAFTVMPKAAVLYAFEPQEVQFAVGAELGYFRIRDYFRNSELFVDGGYNITASSFYANFGFRFFLNLRA